MVEAVAPRADGVWSGMVDVEDVRPGGAGLVVGRRDAGGEGVRVRHLDGRGQNGCAPTVTQVRIVGSRWYKAVAHCAAATEIRWRMDLRYGAAGSMYVGADGGDDGAGTGER